MDRVWCDDHHFFIVEFCDVGQLAFVGKTFSVEIIEGVGAGDDKVGVLEGEEVSNILDGAAADDEKLG